MALRSFRSLVLGAALVTAAFSGAARAQEPAAPPPPVAASPAPVASAEYSRWREIASWMIVAAIGARMTSARDAISPSGDSLSSPPKNSSM